MPRPTSRHDDAAAQERDVELIRFALRLLANNGPHSERHAVKAGAALEALVAEKVERMTTTVYEGVVYDPTTDSGRKAILTAEGEYVYIEDALYEDQRVRVTIEVLDAE